tara:strand:+ start:426 stop:911 length:486 start_codon:yes stop_codon:yes gene_type:complete
MKVPTDLPIILEEVLGKDSSLEDRIKKSLNVIFEAFDAKNCTFHRVDVGDSFLYLVEQIGLPEKIAEIASKIPIGKGMAGICAERKEPVTMCNLQTDDSGVARPAAKNTKVEGAVVVPLVGESGEVIATLGIGREGEHEYSEEEVKLLEQCAQILMIAILD